MSEIDENQIHDRLKRLSQIEPAQDAAERAVKQVRDVLMADEGRNLMKGCLPSFGQI
ncbi:MAG TPA: hypothetical protein VMW24_09035 [Sedimentisphaerales bacterium]|nr:hypothetical protein [Sedimentisphaerales bacterium]